MCVVCVCVCVCTYCRFALFSALPCSLLLMDPVELYDHIFGGEKEAGCFTFLWLETSQQAHNIKMTSYQRRCDVITSHRR